MILYNILKRMIERGETTNLADKIDVFYAVGRITQEQYEELAALLGE